MGLVGVALGSMLNVLLLSMVARRLLGVAVGWPRTILVSVVVIAGSADLIVWTLGALGLPTSGPVADWPTVDQAALALVIGLAVAWLVAIEVGILAVLEALVPTGALPGPLGLVRGLPARWRRFRRYVTILRIAVRHGLGRYFSRRQVTDDRPAPATAAALREALTAGGVTFVKLGQMLSTRPDLLPDQYVAELSRLHADVPPQPWEVVATTLANELGRDPAAVFAQVEELPMASASVGQVHRAVLQDGRTVVVKVQRSDARAQVSADLDIVTRLAGWLERRAPWARALGVRGLADGFAASLEEELDYGVEAANVAAVRAAVQDGSRVRVPQMHGDLSTRRMLVMEQMPGQPLSKAGATLASFTDERRREIANDLLSAVLDQVMRGGVFHADLHAGNVLVDDDGRLSLLDFGSVGRLDRGARASMGMLLLAVDRQDAAAATQAIIDLLDAPPTLDDRVLERDVGDLVMRFGHAQGQASDMFVELLRMVLRHGLSVPPGVAAAFRSLGALEGTLQILHPGIDLVAVARDQGRSSVGDRFTPTGLKAELTDQLGTLLPMVQRLPRRASSVVEDLHSGTFTVTVRALQSPSERRFLTGLVQQIVLALLTATTALSGVAVVLAGQGPVLAGDILLTAYLGMVLILFAFVLGCRAVVLVFRTDHENRHE